MPEQPVQVHVEQVMGTVVSIHVRGDRDASDAFTAVVSLLHAVDRRFSTYRADSEVNQYRRGELASGPAGELAEVLEQCRSLHGATGGAFDAFAGGEFDPSAWVKGWSIDRAGDLLVELGHDDWMINAGGDVLVNAPATSSMWRIGVQHPIDPTALATVLHARQLAVATSGSYFRGRHLVDPRTGEAATGALSTTVCGPSLGVADALSTAAFVLGADGPQMVARQRGYDCWTVLPDQRVRSTFGFPRLVQGVPISVDRRGALGAAA